MLLGNPSFYNKLGQLTKRDVPDCIWPTDNDYGIPVLKLTHQANALDMPFILWGSKKRTYCMNGTWGFYVDDYRFSALQKNPHQIINSGCISAIEVNFSLYEMMPKALVLYKVYQKRWLSRYWQEHGNIRIFVDLNVNEEHAEDNLLGVPKGWKSYCTRGYKDSLENYDFQFNLACEKAETDDITFCIYGGGKDIKQLCMDKHWLWIPERMDSVKNKEIARVD